MILNSIRNKGNWWYNLYNHCLEQSEHPEGVTKKELNEILKFYNAKYVYAPWKTRKNRILGHNIRFKRKEDMVMFILRYS